MDRRTQRTLAVIFSIPIVTATLTPASAALSPPNQSQTDSSLTDLVKKLTAQAGSGEKEILVVTTKEFYGQYESQLKKISNRVKTDSAKMDWNPTLR